MHTKVMGRKRKTKAIKPVKYRRRRNRRPKAMKPTPESMRDMRLLQQGFIPDETKIGTSFKGKNRVVIAK